MSDEIGRIRFLQSWTMYNAGEIAGFHPDRCKRLIALGLAEWYVPDESESAAGPTPPTEPEATEAAVKLAAEAGVDLSTVSGNGRGGRVTKADVQQHIDAAAG